MSKGQEYKAYGSIRKMKVGGACGVILALAMLGMVVSTGSVLLMKLYLIRLLLLRRKVR